MFGKSNVVDLLKNKYGQPVPTQEEVIIQYLKNSHMCIIMFTENVSKLRAANSLSFVNLVENMKAFIFKPGTCPLSACLVY